MSHEPVSRSDADPAGDPNTGAPAEPADPRGAAPAPPPEPPLRGPLAWMASNAVAANLLMIFFLVGGLLFIGSLTQEVFPEIELDMVTVTVAYPGASPEEIEEGVLLAVEEEVRGIDGIKEVRSIAVEGRGVVTAELLTGADDDRALNDVKSAVDRITSLPQDAERPVISLVTNRNQVLNLVLHGEVARKTLDALAEELRAELLLDRRVTLVEIDGVPPPEISVEVSQESLRRYGLTLQQVAGAIAAASVDLPGGSVKTRGGEVLVRTTERRDFGAELEEIAVVRRPDGSRVLLRDLATVVDGYRDTDDEAYYEGQPAVRLRVFRVGDETPIEVAAAARELVERRRASLPPVVGVALLDDQSKIYQERIDLLLENGRLGAFLVLLVLGLFLQPRLAFWVAAGIPISFFGAFLVMPLLDVSINMVSLFAFILVLGIVVDDAIVVGEAVFHHRMLGKSPLRAAVDGTREVLAPVIFAVTTTIFAFAPLLFIPGITGKFFEEIPLIVIPILVISLIESLLILPAHLAHVKLDQDTRLWRAVRWAFDRQQAFSDLMERWIAGPFQRFLRGTVAHRYLAIALAVALLVVAVGAVAGNHLKFYFFPRVEGDQIHAGIELPFGAPVEETRAAMERVSAALREVIAHAESERDPDDGRPPLLEGLYAQIGISSPPDMSGVFGTVGGGGHLAMVQATLSPSDQRTLPASELTRRWRQAVGEIPGVERLAFSSNTGVSAGPPVALELSHRDTATLERAATALAGRLGTYDGVYDIDDGFQVGKPQLDLELRPSAKALGLDEAALATQVRSAFFGAEAKRQQRGRDELRIYVRRPEAERQSVFHIENLLVRTPAGGEIPLQQAAVVDLGRSYTRVERVDGRRTVTVSAEVDDQATTPNRVIGGLVRDVLPELMADFPGLTYAFAGEQEAQAEAMGSLARGMALAILAMYGLLAIAFRSYAQPLVVLAAIPFGIIGAILGHLLLGYSLSFMSLFGIVALSGVVVNDSLVLIAAINDNRRAGLAVREAVIIGTVRRVRAVMLTSLTTFFGLAPIILERSMQARFLIPMAISLGFGVLFVTFISLLLVPCGYLALDDLKRRGRRAEDARSSLADDAELQPI